MYNITLQEYTSIFFLFCYVLFLHMYDLTYVIYRYEILKWEKSLVSTLICTFAKTLFLCVHPGFYVVFSSGQRNDFEHFLKCCFVCLKASILKDIFAGYGILHGLLFTPQDFDLFRFWFGIV